MILIVLLSTLLILICIKIRKTYTYWIIRGVKQQKIIYLCQDSLNVLFGRKSQFDMMASYKAFPEERYVGFYQSNVPTFLIRDPELIKLITVKDFDHFVNHRQLVPDGLDAMWTKSLPTLKGNQWRQMRATLSPSFTSSKMKIIFNLISECADEYLKYFKNTNDTKVIELKDTFTRYAIDVITTTAFGVKCDSINERTNEFYRMGKDASNFSFRQKMTFIVCALAPKLAKLAKLRVFPEHVSNFFTNAIVNTIKAREEQGIVRRDIIHLLLKARKGKNKVEQKLMVNAGFATAEEVGNILPRNTFEITDMDIAAQAMIFFIAGFESVSTTMCFMAYELVLNADIQRRLQEEIDETLQNCNGKLTYEALMKMKYMDMVVSETLRKWSTVVGTDRVCTKSYTIEPVNSNEKRVTLEPGNTICIPFNAIHKDPTYYRDPEKFDPERFSDENKNDIKPYTYMPFGLGPRNCIGSRFALMEMKAIYFNLLCNFDFVVVEKTEIPLQIKKKAFGMQPKNGIWVGLKPRNLK